MKNSLKSITRAQWLTVAFILFYLVYEFIILADWKAETAGPLIRVDLLLIYPLICLGAAISLFQFWQKHKAWGALIFGVAVGGMIATTLLWYQMDNRELMGYNNGYTTGSLDLSHFLQDHLEGKAVDPYVIKYVVIKPVRTNGVRTFEIIE